MTYITSVERIGIEKGRKEGKRKIALNLLRLNVPLETIAQGTGLSITEIQQLQTESEQQ